MAGSGERVDLGGHGYGKRDGVRNRMFEGVDVPTPIRGTCAPSRNGNEVEGHISR